jgi:hypothetical protein
MCASPLVFNRADDDSRPFLAAPRRVVDESSQAGYAGVGGPPGMEGLRADGVRIGVMSRIRFQASAVGIWLAVYQRNEEEERSGARRCSVLR